MAARIVLAAGALAACGVGAAAGPAGQGGQAGELGSTPPLGPGTVTVELGVAHSAFTGGDVRVVAGTTVRFVLDNGDPIGHELIVGPPEVHARHATGHEASHPPVPGEVSVGPNGRAETTYTFDEPGTVEYACHLPGHYAYGMHGEIAVVPA
ncbi:MAG TPA: plastocyanin/azurin family copper-binding protein [Acidimicrobiales bacterium]|nr:plastocyanin/azurin family copper-binding protein [Acidimicrobiales bacterium]